MTKGKWYLILQALVCMALTVLFSMGAVHILQEGSARKADNPMESIYTPEIVAEKFAPIAPLFFAGIGLLIAGLVLGVKDEHAETPVKNSKLGRNLLAAHIVRPSQSMLKERRLQKNLFMTGLGVFTVCMIPILVYILNPVHFPRDDLEGMFFGILRVFLPWTAAGLGALTITSILQEKSLLREMQAAQARLKEEKVKGIAFHPKHTEPLKKTGILQTVIIILAVIFVIAGVLNGSARDVLYKAITICTECVGLG